MERPFREDVVPYEELLQTIESTDYTQVLKGKNITGVKLMPENSEEQPFYKDIEGVFESEEGTKITIFFKKDIPEGKHLARVIFPSSTPCWIAEPHLPEPEVTLSIEDLQRIYDTSESLGSDPIIYLGEFKTNRFGQQFFLNSITFKIDQHKITFDRKTDNLKCAFIDQNQQARVYYEGGSYASFSCSEYTPEYVPNLFSLGRVYVN